MHRIKASVLAGMALALLVACSDDEATAPDPITGTYQLSDADGETLPVLIFEGLITGSEGDFVLRILVDEGSLELSAGQRYEQRVTRSISVDGHAQPGGLWYDRGTYTLRGDTLRFASELIEGARFSGTLAAGRISLDQDLSEENRWVTYRYTK